jgi:GT2 family glycosyltransferase
MVRVSVIVVNWNGKHLLERCLPAVMSQSFDGYEVILLDNGSTDGSAEWVEGHLPDVRVIRKDRNLGFAQGNNEAIRVASGAYIATLNNDAEPAPGWLGELVEAIESSPQVGMCASKMVRADDPTVMDACGIQVDRAGIGWNRYSGQAERREESSPYEVFGPCAGAALYRRAMLDQVGLFDEDYFACYEDVDLAWRAQRAGWRCLYVPRARVTHRHSSTLKEGSLLKGYLLGRNKLWTLIKNYPWPDWLISLPLIVGYDLAAWGIALLSGDPGPLRGRVAALKSFPPVAGKRPGKVC